MKRSSLLIKLALLVCAAISVVSAPPSSMAYLAANSNTVHNSFRVVYQPAQDIIVPVRIQKSMVSLSDQDIGPGGFDFHLVDMDTGEITTATALDDGSAAVYLPFSEADLGQTFNYCLYEIDSGRKYVSYDDTVYKISITILLNEQHELSAQILVNGRIETEITAKFVNRYYVPVPLPETGDSARPLLWTVMLALSGTGLIVLRIKRKNFRRL